jgi:hypothetical protein
MRFTEAFAKLGYKVRAPRTDWSATSDDGVCLSLWRTEINWTDLSFDTQIDAGPPDTWNPAGNNRRKQHIAEALDEVSLASNKGFSSKVLSQLMSVIESRAGEIERAWNDHFG